MRCVASGLSPEEYIATLDHHGIQKAVACVPFYLQSDYILGNRIVRKLIKNYPDRIIGFATSNPLFEKEAIDELQRCIEGHQLRLLRHRNGKGRSHIRAG